MIELLVNAVTGLSLIGGVGADHGPMMIAPKLPDLRRPIALSPSPPTLIPRIRGSRMHNIGTFKRRRIPTWMHLRTSQTVISLTEQLFTHHCLDPPQ